MDMWWSMINKILAHLKTNHGKPHMSTKMTKTAVKADVEHKQFMEVRQREGHRSAKVVSSWDEKYLDLLKSEIQVAWRL